MTKITNNFHIAGNYIAEMTIHNDIHDNHNCPIYAVPAAQEPSPESSETPTDIRTESILPIPKEGKYTKVREYIKERSRFDEEFKTFVKEKSLRDLCSRLTKEFGWFVDEHSLGSNLNRHRKE